MHGIKVEKKLEISKHFEDLLFKQTNMQEM